MKRFHISILLLIFAIISLKIADTLTTLIALKLGAEELNPIIAYFMTWFPKDMVMYIGLSIYCLVFGWLGLIAAYRRRIGELGWVLITCAVILCILSFAVTMNIIGILSRFGG